MKGKILISIVALGASSLALANGSNMAITKAEPVYFDGFVVGVDAGMQHLNGNVQDSTGYTTDVYNNDRLVGTTYTDTPTLNTDIGDNVLGGGIFAGYGKVFNQSYYIGGEIYARYAHNTTNTNVDSDIVFLDEGDAIDYGFLSTSINVNSDWSYGAALKLGYLVTPKTMIYLLAGVEYSKFSLDVNHTLSSEEGPASSFSYSYSFDNNKLAFVPGVGIETMLTDKLSLKAEYTYVDYGKFSHNNNSSSLISNPSEPSSFAILNNPSEDQVDIKRGLFTLGLAYRFNGI